MVMNPDDILREMNDAVEEFDRLATFLSMRRDCLNYLSGRFANYPSLKCTADIFWAANQSYNAQIVAEAKKIIKTYNDDGTKKEDNQ